ncbi:MAG: AAA family ATPase [Euryarchaeota archaeon]|nr:AAA family ATPase [Euryarchaeota archaeon]
MKIVGFVGMPGSGKSVAAEVARQMGIQVVVMGDVIRDEAARLGLEPCDQNLGRVGNLLRERGGACAVAQRCLEKIGPGLDLVVVEGIRSKDEVDFFRSCCRDFCLIEVYVPEEVRLERIASRRRSDDGSDAEAVAERDNREIKWGMDLAIKAANRRIENDGPVEELRRKVEGLLRDYMQSMQSRR